MQAAFSKALTKAKPTLQKLLDALLAVYPFASVLACDTRAKVYSVSRAGSNISENGLLGSSGYVIKVYDGESYGEYSFNELNEQAIPRILTRIAGTLMPLKDKLPAGLTSERYDCLPDEAMTLSKATDYELHPETLGDEAILGKLLHIREQALHADERLLDCSAFANWQSYSKLFLSKNRCLEQSVLWTTGGMSLMAARGEEIKEYYRGFSCLGGAELFDQMAEAVPQAVETVVALLDSLPMTPGEYDCVCTPEVTGMIVHEAFGHGVEMDMFVKDRALARSYIGKRVASPLVTMYDGAAAVREAATCFFDDEGTPTGETKIIDKGILVAGMSDAQSAMFLGSKPTGNGRRESFARKAYTRMTNTYFAGGTDSVEDMITSIKDGFLLDNPTSGMEDPKNWGIQCMVNFAREIKDGKLTGRLFSPIVLTGYVPDLLESISMMSPDVELSGGGYCGKGYKEWVKVSDGGPYIKARIRLG